MGSAGTRFGRNFPLEHTFPEQEPRLSTPNPRTVSLDLMTRQEFLPATTLNVLAAAWIQFEVHDWFSHGPNDLEEPYEISLGDGDEWPEQPMVIRDPRDATCDPGTAQTWRTADTHWWDSSQIYGRTRSSRKRRAPGRRQDADRSGRDAPGRPRGGPRLRRRAGDALGRPCGPAHPSHSSTTQSAIACAPSTRHGRTRSSTTRRGSVTAR